MIKKNFRVDAFVGMLFSKKTITKAIFLFVILTSLNLTAQTCSDYTVNPNTTITTAANVTYNTTINVPDSFTISDVNVSVNITHTWNSDLEIFLISPTGTRVELSTANGGSGENYNATFDDASTNNLPTNNSTINGTFNPEGNLSDFNSENSSGNWTLEVTDAIEFDGGTINTVTLNLCYEIDTDNDGVPDSVDIDDDNDGILDKDECKGTTPDISDFNNYTNSNTSGWQLINSTQVFNQEDNINNDTFSSPTINFSNIGLETLELTFDIRTNGINDFINSSQIATLEFVINGVIYATFSNLSANTTATAVASNGATVSPATFSVTTTTGAFTSITLSIPNPKINNTIDWVFTANGDDFYIKNLDWSGASATALCTDTDNDGIIDKLDLDSDNDGCPDAIEASVHSTLQSSGIKTDGITDNTENAVINTSLDAVGDNGFAASLESNDTSSATANDAFIATNYATYALDNTKSGCGIAMITQVVQTTSPGANRYIEITNIHSTAVVPANSLVLSLFQNKTGDQTGVSPTYTATNNTVLNPGESLLFKRGSSSLITNVNAPSIVDTNITRLWDGNDILTLSTAKNNLTWESKTDVINSITNNTGYVRIDSVIEPNATYTASEWVAFVDDNLDPYRDLANGGPERHPHDPLYSEIATSNTEANTLLGLHRTKLTARTNGAWNNGFPDRSRNVHINQHYNHTGVRLSARELLVQNNKNLTIDNNLLVVTNDIELRFTNDQIRLVGNSQLIQTHTDATKITGDGKLYIDQNSEVPSKYRYNYLSSPVNTVGSSTFSIEDVLKDGTNPTSFSGTPGNNMAQDITFVGGYDGNTSSPIAIADYWIYTYASGDGGRSNWSRKGKAGDIPQTDGFTFKGPGQAQNYTFSGTPKDGNLPTAIGANESYLVGNPYASAMSAKKFIEDNIDAIDGTLYFWQHAGEEDTSTDTSGHNFAGYVGGYSTRNISMGLSADQVTSNDNSDDSTPSLGSGSYTAPKPYIAVGQGFFISGDTDGGAITFNNSQREYKTEGTESVFFRTASAAKKVTKVRKNTLPIIKLGLDYKDQNDAGLHRQIGISFNKNNTFASDKGYDSKVYVESNTDFYWKFDEDENKYAIAGVQAITPELEVPLELVVENAGELTIKIDEWQYINRNVFLKDIENDTIYKLNDSKATLNLASGTYTDRFALAFDSENEDEATKETKNPLKVFYNKKNNRIVVVKKDKIKVKQVSLFRINSRKVQNWNIKKQRNKFKLKLRKKFSKGLYVVKIKTNKGIINKKIVIKN
ncbi:putative secreted protein (Por secretion system target) [Lutibacter sp. Hel_I_33_5]|uniref:proprotein convertase P-domain-containing protein n=1 Tax=Lutibacter sp. Hel_I_33_5 TaxID=1566289 RepID=UPI00119C924C|nr:proprotein convertase P-domain-containing protein [Lutibacter sp. Hel_I_33_5]TVZ57259.1 putative secreted protein (Por secretion system target) [Lutibacter sp. Hel_I_33_5]